jgi:hypothetical protein
MMTEVASRPETSVSQTTHRLIPEDNSPKEANTISLNSQMFSKYYNRQPLG